MFHKFIINFYLVVVVVVVIVDVLFVGVVLFMFFSRWW